MMVIAEKMVRAFRYVGGALVACEHVGPRMPSLEGEMGGHLLWNQATGELAVLYLPLGIVAPSAEDHERVHAHMTAAAAPAGGA
jgi:hypothetical protein